MRAMEVRQLQSHMQSDPGQFSLLCWEQLATELKANGEGAGKPLGPGLSLQTQVLQVFTRLILGLCGGEVVFQEALQVLESGPLFGVLFPAVDHELVEGDGAVLRTGHPVAALHLLQHLPVVHACKDKGHESGCAGLPGHGHRPLHLLFLLRGACGWLKHVEGCLKLDPVFNGLSHHSEIKKGPHY